MDYYIARQQHTEWLKQNLEREEQALAEAEARVIQLQGSVIYYKQALEQLAPSDSESTIRAGEDGNNFSQEDADGRKQKDAVILLPSSRRYIQANYVDEKGGIFHKPRDMMRLQYKNKTLGEAIAECLESKIGLALGPEQITKDIFEIESLSSEDRGRAKNSLSAELRRGAKEQRWRQVGRGLFAANLTAYESEQEETLIIGAGNGFVNHKPLPV